MEWLKDERVSQALLQASLAFIESFGMIEFGIIVWHDKKQLRVCILAGDFCAMRGYHPWEGHFDWQEFYSVNKSDIIATIHFHSEVDRIPLCPSRIDIREFILGRLNLMGIAGIWKNGQLKILFLENPPGISQLRSIERKLLLLWKKFKKLLTLDPKEIKDLVSSYQQQVIATLQGYGIKAWIEGLEGINSSRGDNASPFFLIPELATQKFFL